MNQYVYKSLIAAAGGVLALFTSIIPLLWVCFFFVLIDGLSAYELNKRVIKKAKKMGKKVPRNAGRFRSSRAYKMITTMRDIAILIALGHMLDTQVFGFFNGLNIANYITGVFCILQAWSILENASSCNGAHWAKILQKIMVDKTERHLNIDLSGIDGPCSPQEIEEIKKENPNSESSG